MRDAVAVWLSLGGADVVGAGVGEGVRLCVLAACVNTAGLLWFEAVGLFGGER